jgi:hypothetical protein
VHRSRRDLLQRGAKREALKRIALALLPVLDRVWTRLDEVGTWEFVHVEPCLSKTEVVPSQGKGHPFDHLVNHRRHPVTTDRTQQIRIPNQ